MSLRKLRGLLSNQPGWRRARLQIVQTIDRTNRSLRQLLTQWVLRYFGQQSLLPFRWMIAELVEPPPTRLQ
jgi:hypothetical protein